MATNNKKEAICMDLPKGWQAIHSKTSSNIYYFNVEAKKTQWEHPVTGKKTKAIEDHLKLKKSKSKGKLEQISKMPHVSKKKQQQKAVPETTTSVKIKTEFQKPANLNSKLASDCQRLRGGVKFTLPPLTRAKSHSAFSEDSTSDSSERIRAWLENTSKVNFQEYPVPDVNDNENRGADRPKCLKKNVLSLSKKHAKKIKEEKKGVILERVKTSSKSLETTSTNILDDLLPKAGHAQQKGLGKNRYAPYKISRVVSDSNKKPYKDEQVIEIDRLASPNKKRTRESGESLGLANRQTQNNKLKLSKSERSIGSKSKNGPNSTMAKASRLQRTDFLSGENAPVSPCTSTGQLDESAYEELLVNINQDDLQGEVLLMDEEDGVDMPIPQSESEVEMEIDNAEEFEKEIVQKLKQVRDSLVVDPTSVSSRESGMNLENYDYEGTLYIVLDTNVLLSHLKFVTELKDFPIQGIGRPTLIVPWVVIQELDSLKDNKWKMHKNQSADSSDVEERVDMLARVAIKFLNGCFQKSDARVRGQTVDEAAVRVGNLKEETNDDRILQCCLLFRERAETGKCVLFSNDKNLCNKALINGIKAFTHQRLIPGLRDLFQCGVIVKQAYFKEYESQLGIQEELAWRRARADEILCELQIILREGLSYIIETEMREAYDDMWETIVLIKPPWTLADVLQLLEKHWIAVFGHILQRSHKTFVEELRNKFDDRKGTSISLVFSSEVLQLSVKLFQSFAAHSNYNDAIQKCLAAVNVLLQKCQQYESNSVARSSSHITSQPKYLTMGPAVTAQTPAGSTSSGSVDKHDGLPPHEEVMNTFNVIWTAVTQFSSQIYAALGYPNAVPHEVPQDLPTATKEETVQFLGLLCPRLVNLVNSIKNVLKDPWEKASRNNSLFLQLEHAIAVFLKEVISRENCATAPKLFSFCQDVSMRTSLHEGLSQLDRASAMLQHCASWVSQPGGIR